MSSDADRLEGIAVVGMACRFPGANSAGEFWDNLVEGKESVKFFTDQELRAAGILEEHLNNPNYVKAAPLIDYAEHFDAEFFGLSPKEALSTDPQHRIFLECSWTAIENAGYDPLTFPSAIGIFAGCSLNHYVFRLLEQKRSSFDDQSLMLMIGAEKDFLATRVAYLLNLRGPALTIQTACSTSLVAIHQACQSLWNYECDMALAGAATVRAPRVAGYFFREGEIFSPDGHCRPFDEQAAGTIFGEGVGVVVLKRLEEAIRDRDTITAVIRGVAINNDGNQKTGFTAPSVAGQAEVLATALAMASIPLNSYGMVEAHGSGTQLGDPIEVAALLQVLKSEEVCSHQIALGSVKSNCGHLDAAAGIAGFFKAALAVKHGIIPPSLHFNHPNPHLGLDGSPFFVPTRVTPWPQILDRTGNSLPRIAGVSSFGVGGTNAHVILEEPPTRVQAKLSSKKARILVLSAKQEDALNEIAANIGRDLISKESCSIDDIAYTLCLGRNALPLRGYVVAQDCQKASESLLSKSYQIIKSSNKLIQPVFMFPGQGSQFPAMIRDIYHKEQAFRKQIDLCAELLFPYTDMDIRQIIVPEPGEETKSAELMMQTQWTQPALFCVEYSLALLLADWGITPAAMIGHSIGEYVAAALAGVFRLSDALRLVATRGRVMQEQPRGAMLAINLPEDQTFRYLNDGLELALVNSPSHCVIGGQKKDIETLKERLTLDKVKYSELRTSHAFHTRLIEGARENLVMTASSIDRQKPCIPFISNLTGSWITDSQALDPEYWAAQMRGTVRYSKGVSTLLTAGYDTFVEVGPGVTLSTLLQFHKEAKKAISIPTIRQINRPSYELVLDAVGSLWSHGVNVDWLAIFNHENFGRVALPTYPFRRTRFWAEHTQHPDFPKANIEKKIEAEDYDLSLNKVEEIVQNIWKEILGVNNPGQKDNFFDLGGHSLLAAQFIARIRDAFSIAYPMPTFFSEPTISLISSNILDILRKRTNGSSEESIQEKIKLIGL